MKTTPLVSVVILNWNGIDDTKICLKYLKKQTYKNYEVIVVDNGSTDDSVEQLKKNESIKLIKNEKNRGFTGGHIDGLKYASGEFILLLNNDAVMKPDLIEQAVQNFSDPQVAVVGGRAYSWNEDNELLDESNSFYSYQFVNTTTAEAIFYQKDYGVPEEVNNVSGSCVMVRKSVIDEFGYLENAYFAYYEEADLFARYKRAGFKIIYDPKVQIWHKIGASSEKKSSSFMYYMLFRNRFFFAVRHFDQEALWPFIKAYVSFGLKCTVKTVLRRGDPAINKPFMRAYIYNLLHFPSAFQARSRLARPLGASDYIKRIKVEQANVSHIVITSNIVEIERVVNASRAIRPSHEVVIVSSKKYDIPLPHNVRIIHDKKYFDTYQENVGAITARYDWLSFSSVSKFCDDSYIQNHDRAVFSLLSAGSEAYCHAVDVESDILTQPIDYSQPILLSRTRFLQIHGLPSALSVHGSLRIILAYTQKLSTLHISTDTKADDLEQSLLTSTELEGARSIVHDAVEATKQTKPPRFYEPIFKRYYRLQQIRFLFHWYFSPKIAVRVKLGRTKNLIRGVFTLDIKRIAFHMKHIRTEILLAKGLVRNLEAQKKLSKQSFRRLLSKPDQTVIFIICRDRLTPLLELIAWLEAAGMKRIVLIDNDSIYPELVKYLQTTTYQVLDMKRNAGHTVAWSQYVVPTLVPNEYYIVTDPDVIPAISPSVSVIKHLYEIHSNFPNHLKVGFGLKIDDLPDHYSLKESVIKWESQFWTSQLSPGTYEAGVDTTFALYKPFTYDYIIHPSLRLGEPYTARHLPWYSDDSELNAEDLFYRLHADQNVNTWNKGALPERYLKELKRLERKR